MEKQPNPILLNEQNNCFLIDWLTVTIHGCHPDYVKWLIGMDRSDIPWKYEEKFRNGYPVHESWNGVTISYGADDVRFYKDGVDKKGVFRSASDKVRNDMGVCLNMSGTGCRAFESYGNGNWSRLFDYLTHNPDYDFKRDGSFFRANVTRLDIAYDDHVGILDIHQMELDVRDRNYKSKATYSERHLSDDQRTDIQGTSLYFGSKSSPVLIRIYDKAAERGFNDRHWVRVEMQLRDERAKVFLAELVCNPHLGQLASGVLRNYLCFLTPTGDSNRSRWPLAFYWDRLLLDMLKISLWRSPGTEYNISKTEHWLLKQYGPAMRVLDIMYGSDYLIKRYRELYPECELNAKYQGILDSWRLDHPNIQPEKVSGSVWDSWEAKYGLVEQFSVFEDETSDDPECPF